MISLFLFTNYYNRAKWTKIQVYLDRDIKKDLNIANNLSDFRQIDTTFKLIPNNDLLHKRNSLRFDLNPDMIIQHHLEINHSRSYAYAEEYARIFYILR